MYLESRMWGHMSTTDLPGSSLLAGRYRLVERLGAGGMSVVWRGFDEVLGRQVAVKVLPPSTSADPSFRRRLRAEAQAAARLSHPHITNVYDYGEATTVDGEPVPYVVMELVDGESLAAVLARVRRLPWPAAVRICAEVSAALAAAHSRGIVHRDVTPANVMLTSSGAKVVDFGISALIGENDIDPDGSLLGTPAYLAPERLEGGQVSPATDVYAVGLLIYRTLIGQLPWDVGTTTALLRAHQYTEPEPLPPVEGLPAEVDELVARCLEKRPVDRPSSAEVADVLGSVSAGVPAAARNYVPDWGDNGEDTTILPSQQGYTDGIGRVRPGHAKVADSAPSRAGRGVASVRGGAADPAALAGAGAAAAGSSGAVAAGSSGAVAAGSSGALPPPRTPMHSSAGRSAALDAPVSPAPGTPIPVPVSDVEAAVQGMPVAGVKPAAADADRFGPADRPGQADTPGEGDRPGQAEDPGQADWRRPADRPAAGAVPPAPPATGNGRGPGASAGPRNSRFSSPPPRSVAPAAAAAAGLAAAPAGSAPLRSAFGNGPDDMTVAPGGGGGAPPPGKNSRFGGRGKPGPTPGARRVMVLAGTVLALGLVTYGWSLLAGDRGGSPHGAQAQPKVMAPVGKCVVSYTVLSQTATNFKASVTVANRDTVPVKDWNLWFVMPGDQTMSGNGKEKLYQDDRGVTVTSPDTLAPQQTKTMQITGRFQQSNAAPMVFKLDNQTCEAFVSGKPGDPSRPVERLSDGTTRLGPVPTSPTPVPGITIGPGGVAVPVPIKTTSTKPNSRPTVTVGSTQGPTAKPTEAPTESVPAPTPPADDPTTEPPTAAPTTQPTVIDTVPTDAVIGGGNSCDPADC
jgi:hypothetical protein